MPTYDAFQASGRANVPLKVWSALALGALVDSPESPALLMNMISFGISYSNALNGLSDQLSSQGVFAPSAGSEVNHGYAAVKLWLLLAQRVGDRGQMDEKAEIVNSDGEQRRVWNEAWPPFERLLNLSITNSDEASLVSTVSDVLHISTLRNKLIQFVHLKPILTMIWGSYIDLIMFLQTSGSVLAMDFAVTHTTMLQRLCGAAQAGSSLHKVSRLMRSLLFHSC